ncbi:spore coat protein [Bacillus sp. DNRA2]|uniref:CotY/CotZ family spore coat protein n=1 Tax=Bacillus sp. DNRA2 TaxID=2723053 RepID=UPI00145EF0A1|nr:CotY/CotZ family spore coat protein [Bacillus sp. DNRA2]NMD69328.1 spore coat protein [Bacillus sp. DNRA2]
MEKQHQDSKYFQLNKKNSQQHGNCLKKTLEKIINEQKKVNKKEIEKKSFGCLESLGMPITNTIPFILYGNLEPFKVEGVTKFFNKELNKEKFVCFTTFIFRIIDLDGDCAVLELLKFNDQNTCILDIKSDACSPSCQLNSKDVNDLIAACVYIQVELSYFSAIQCLPAVFIKVSD